MNQDEKIQGLWWLSNKPKTIISGDLSIKERKLELNGSFEGIKSGPIGEDSKFISIQKETILGFSKIGSKKYTLEFYDEPLVSMPFPGYKSDTYSLGTIFEGDHFAETYELSFSNYCVALPYLFEWINNSVIFSKLQLAKKRGKQFFNKAIIEIKKPKKIDIFQNDDIRLFCLILAGGIPILPSKEIHISQECYFKIESLKGNLGLEDFYSVVSHLERFLTIAIGRALKPTSYQATVNNGESSKTIQIFPHFLKKREYAKIYPAEMNFTFSDIKNDSQEIFNNWFSQKEKHQDVFDLFSSINNDTSKNINNQFKDIVSAIEGYVRIAKDDLNITLKKTIKTLDEEVPRDDRPLDPREDYKKIRITRNKLSHVTVKPEDEKFVLKSSEEKFIYFVKLKFLLEYSFLKNMGMNEDLLKKFYKKKKEQSFV